MAKYQNRDRDKDKSKDKDKSESNESKGPDPTLNKDLIPPVVEKPEPAKAMPVPAKTAPAQKAPLSGSQKHHLARKQSRKRQVDAAREQIFHRAGNHGLALGDPIELSRDEDVNESE